MKTDFDESTVCRSEYNQARSNRHAGCPDPLVVRRNGSSTVQATNVRVGAWLWLLVCLLMGLSSVVQAADNSVSWSALRANALPVASEYWVETLPNARLQDAQQAYQQNRFAPTPQGTSFGFTEQIFWFRFRLTYQPAGQDAPLRDEDKAVYLSFDYPHLDSVTLYREAADGALQTYQFGDGQPFHQRAIALPAFVLPLPFQAGQHETFWLRVVTTSSVQMPVSLWHKDRYLERQGHVRLAYGIYLGILLVMAAYNLFLGFSIRDGSYFYYVGYITSFGLLQATLLGYSYQYLWPDMVVWNRTAIPVTTLLSLGFALFFSRYYLNTPQINPHIDKMLVGLAAIAFGLAALCLWLPYHLVINASIWLSLVCSLLLFHTGVLNLLRGHLQARLFVLAWGVLLAGSVIYGFAMKGVLPLNLYTQHAAQIGSAVEVILLSLALADRINRITREKQALESSAKVAMEIKNRELQAALAKVNESNALKDAFLATISHELRTPMNGIEGALQVIEDNTRDRSLLYSVETARFSAHHMMHLVESLLEFSELQSGKLTLNVKPFQLQILLAPLLRHIAMRCAKKGVGFEVYGLAQPFALLGDGERLSHVLFQVLDNAVKFTHQGTLRLRITVQEADPPGPEAPVTTLIELEDTGIGMDRATLERLFETFRQADSSFSRQYGGLGIGLALTRALVKRMGGELVIDSLLGQGTRVTIRLPWQKRALPPAVSVPEPGAEAGQQAGHILIVEDNPVNQMTLKAMVRKLGYRVDTANNGAEAVQRCGQHSYDCVLMDCQMPIMDGFEATRRIRALTNHNAAVPIIAVTANAMSQDRDNCLAAGMNDYLKKPVSKAQLQLSLQQWLTPAQSKAG